jgi:ring-1,2-phenylacetyl-CoA epoxidase subunit PaaE
MPSVIMTETFHRLSVQSVRPTADAVDVTLALPDTLASQFAFKPGQHVMVRATINGVVEQRSYSMCSPTGGPLRFGIKHIPGGLFSSWARDHLKVGDRLEVEPPKGRFVMPQASEPRHVLLLAAGAGITPMLGMAADVLAHEPASRVTLVFGNRTLASAMFLAELEDLKDRHATRFDLVHVLSGSGEADASLLAGRITGEKLKALASQRIDVASVSRAFLCGPGSFIKETRNALFELGLPRDGVHHEFFAGRSGGAAMAAPAPAPVPQTIAARPAGTMTAVAILDGQRHAFPLAKGQHVLDAALKAGIKAPYSCTGGMCSTCRARVVDGTTTMTVNYSLEEWELQRGFVLTCQATATSDTLVIDYDAM